MPSLQQLLVQKQSQNPKPQSSNHLDKNKAAAAKILLRIQEQLDSQTCTVTRNIKNVTD